MVQAGFVAPFAELVAESGMTERSAKIGHKKGHVAARGRINDLLQLRQDRQHKPPRLLVPTFELREGQFCLPDVLRPEACNVATPLPREEQQRQREACFRSDRVPLSILPYFVERPSMIAGWVVALEIRYVPRRIVRQ